jgi:hypothetical protein
MAVALFHGSISRRREAACSAPTKFGMRQCGGIGKRATPSAPSLSQTHCRAALLSAKSRAMTESEQRVLVTVKDAICLMKNLGGILASLTSHSSIEKRKLDAQAEPAPTAIQIK